MASLKPELAGYDWKQLIPRSDCQAKGKESENLARASRLPGISLLASGPSIPTVPAALPLAGGLEPRSCEPSAANPPPHLPCHPSPILGQALQGLTQGPAELVTFTYSCRVRGQGCTGSRAPESRPAGL